VPEGRQDRSDSGEAMRRQANLLQKAFDSMTDALFILDAKLPAPTITECNQAASTVFGYERTEMLGKSTQFLHVSDETLKEFQSLLYSAVEERRLPFQLAEFHMKRKNGTVFPSEHTVSQLKNDKGERIAWVSIVRDITERARAEEKLRLQSEITENMFEGVVLTRASDGVIVYANPRFEETLGYDPGELIGKNIATVNAPVNGKSPEEVAVEIHASLNKYGAWNGEILNIKKDGTPFWCRANISTLESAEYGRVWVETREDITERKRMEDELGRLSQFRESVIDNAHVWIDVLDEKANVVVWNKAAEAISGYSREEVIGHDKIWGWLYPDEEYRRYLTELVADVVQHGRVEEDFETTIRRKDGQVRTISWNERNLVDELGKVIGSIAIGRDITEHKKMEGEIRSLAEFPSQNPSPVLRLDKKGTVLVANQASKALLRDWNCELGQTAPRFWCDLVTEVLSTGQTRNIDIEFGGRCYTFLVKPIVEAGDVNFYGGDITDRKRAEEALRESEARYRALFDSTNDAIFIHDMGRRFLEVNKVFCEVLGYSHEELLQMTPADISSPEYASQVAPRLAELRQVGHAFFQSEYVRRDGTIIQVELSTRIIEYQGKPAVLSIARDITERKRTETALKESEERYRMMFRSMGDAVAVYEAVDQGNDFIFRDFNQAAERIEKVKSEDVIGRRVLELFPGIEDLGLFEVFQRVWKTGKPERLPAGIYKDKRIVGWRENHVYKLPSGELVAVYQDITDRKQLEEELRQYSLHLESLVNERTKELRSAREQLEYVISSNPAVIYTGKPLADGSDFVLTYISDRVSAMLGFEPSDFMGHPEFWERRVHPEDLRLTLAQIPRLWKEGQHAFEYRFLHKNGTYRWIREEAKVVRDTEGKPIEINGYWTDVSERRRLEEELAKSHRLAAIGETSAMIGHDLRNPLQGIAGIVYLAKKNFESRKAADRKAGAALLDTIEEQVMYMDKIVSDLQDYAQPLAPQLTETNLPNLIRQTLSTIKIPETVKVSMKIEKLANNAMIDSTLMMRTLTNLVINAIQAMPKRGKLTIRTRNRGDSIFLTVEDTGVGIPRKNLTKIFNPFFTTKAKGQGLGLAVCKRLVEAQGGTITVKSKPRKGSAITIKLLRGKKEVAS
jgi:PAS domain S-box-containing protein